MGKIEIKYAHDLNKVQQQTALNIFYDAFRPKIEVLELRPKSREQGMQIISECACPHLVLSILDGGQVKGVVGLKTRWETFLRFRWSVLMREFGILGAIWRKFLDFLAKDVIKPTNLYIGALSGFKDINTVKFGFFTRDAGFEGAIEMEYQLSD